jgi:hypothetical protein
MGERTAKEGPFSVTFHPGRAASGDKHDFSSEATYWWPDPDKPERYVKRDGILNPNRFKQHGDDLERLRDTVGVLAVAGYLLDDGRYLDRVAELLGAWFIDEEMRMNPNLEYAKGVPNRSTGRRFGIIELVRLPLILHSIHLLEFIGGRNALLDELKEWFARLLDWLRHSEKGHNERDNGNNHSTWWSVHVGSVSILTGTDSGLQEAVHWFVERLLPTDIADDESQPEEIRRTRSLQYSMYQLNAASLLAEAARHQGIDLSKRSAGAGHDLESAVSFLIQYFDKPDNWPYQEIGDEPDGSQLFLQLAAA